LGTSSNALTLLNSLLQASAGDEDSVLEGVLALGCEQKVRELSKVNDEVMQVQVQIFEEISGLRVTNRLQLEARIR
jgi:hypothetical protein